jgi:hypothetical protein
MESTYVTNLCNLIHLTQSALFVPIWPLNELLVPWTSLANMYIKLKSAHTPLAAVNTKQMLYY